MVLEVPISSPRKSTLNFPRNTKGLHWQGWAPALTLSLLCQTERPLRAGMVAGNPEWAWLPE